MTPGFRGLRRLGVGLALSASLGMATSPTARAVDGAPEIGDTPVAVVVIDGHVRARHEIALGVPVSGRIAAIAFREGARVSQGMEILHLDRQIEELDLERRRLQSDSKAELNQARRKAAILGRQYAAVKALFNDGGAVSRDELERVELDHVSVQGEVARLVVAEAIEETETRLAAAHLELRSLKAPVDGMIASLLKDVGEGVQGNEPILNFIADDQCAFVANVEAHVGNGLVVGAAVDIRVHTGAGPVGIPGTITFVSPVTDKASGLIEIKAEFDNRTVRVRPGTAGTLRTAGTNTVGPGDRAAAAAATTPR